MYIQTQDCRTAFAGYHSLLRYILEYGEKRKDRTGVGTLSVHAPADLSFDLRAGFPAYPYRKLGFNSFFVEVLWFLRGDKNTQYLRERNVKFWDKWADPETGYVGRIYGTQWRRWRTPYGGTADEVDQLKTLLQTAKTQPYSRRLLVSAWNVADLPDMALPPCHYSWQVYIENLHEGEHLQPSSRVCLCVTLRSSDVVIGLPANIGNYAFLTHLIARHLGCEVGTLKIKFIGDAHIYENLTTVAQELIHRHKAQLLNAQLPTLEFLTNNTDILQYDQRQSTHADGGRRDFQLVGYEPLDAIQTEVAV